ncbi:MAG: hypothetical protein ACRD1S_16955 [Vicinamibacterales bacterium]
MQDVVMTYFDGEKNAGILLIGIGLVGIAAAAVFFQARWGLRSLAVTLGVLALAEIALGIGLHLRTDPQVSGLIAQLGSEPARFHSDEGARMVRVQRNFIVIEYVELAIIIVSAIVAVTQKSRPGLTGVALGLLINGAFLLAFDLVAERRGAVYLSAIEAHPQ